MSKQYTDTGAAVAAIRNAVYGKDVREAIAEGIEYCYADASLGATEASNAADEAQELLNDISEQWNNTTNGLKKQVQDAVNGANTAKTQIVNAWGDSNSGKVKEINDAIALLTAATEEETLAYCCFGKDVTENAGS